MMPAMMVVPAVVVMARNNHVRHDDMMMPMDAAMMVMPALVMVILRENERARVFRGDAAIDRAGARGARQSLCAADDERPG